MTSTAHAPGEPYLWPAGIPAPDGYPPFNFDNYGRLILDAAKWQKAHGGYVPHVPKFLRDYEANEQIPRGSGARFVDIHCRVNAGEDVWNGSLYRISSDYKSIAGWASNHTLLFREGRRRAYAGGGEMRSGFEMKIEGPQGAGKTHGAVQLAGADFYEARASGWSRQFGFTGKWKMFGPWDYCASILTWREGRKKYPKGRIQIVDDPLTLPDAVSEELERLAYIEITNSGQIERAPGNRHILPIVKERRIPESNYTDIGYCQKGFVVPDRYGMIQRKERGDTDVFHLTGFLVAMSPRLDLGGDWAISGDVFIREIRKIKLAEHERHFAGAIHSKPVAALDILLARRPQEAVAHCFTHGKLYGWLRRVLSYEYGFTEKICQELENDLWQASGGKGARGYCREVTGTNDLVLFDEDGKPVAWKGHIPSSEECTRIITPWRIELQPIKAVDKEDWRERARKVQARRAQAVA